jgi:hypothetical protein
MSPNISKLIEHGKARERIVQALLGAFKVGAGMDMAGVDLEVKLSFDVKAQKKIRRSDPEPSSTHTWLELKKPGGSPGWAVDPEGADYIVFESTHSWLVVDKLQLTELIKANVIREYVDEAREWHCYRRQDSGNAHSTITLVALDQIRAIASIVITKN